MPTSSFLMPLTSERFITVWMFRRFPFPLIIPWKQRLIPDQYGILGNFITPVGILQRLTSSDYPVK